jgi:superfamily I DNA and/or RNA helicase
MDAHNILNYWLSCVREQDIQKTELGDKINGYQYIDLDETKSSTKSQTDSVSLIIKKELIDLLKVERIKQTLRNSLDSRPVFFFPLVEINYKIYPLFFVDLQDNEQQILSAESETTFEINPWSVDTKIGLVSDTFVKLGYDEENIDLNDSIISFIEKLTGEYSLNFQKATDMLLNFLKEEAESNNGKGKKVQKIYHKGVLKYSDFSEASLVFKKDLILIRDEPHLKNDPLINQFLAKKTNGVNYTYAPYIGNFYNYPLSLGQASAISDINNGKRDIISIQGGPGTGKTTLIMNIISTDITKRALNIALDRPYEIGHLLVTSFTNKAVDNVFDIYASTHESKFQDWMFISLGNKEKRGYAGQRISRFIKALKIEDFDRNLFSNLKDEIIKSYSGLSTAYNQTNGELNLENSDINYVRNTLGYKGKIKEADITHFLSKKLGRDTEISLPEIIKLLKSNIIADERSLEDLKVDLHIRRKSLLYYNELIHKNKELKDIKNIKEILCGKEEYTNLNTKKGLMKKILELFIKTKPVRKSNINVTILRCKDLLKSKGFKYEYLYSNVNKENINLVIKRIERKRKLYEIVLKMMNVNRSDRIIEGVRSNHLDESKAIFEASLNLIYQYILYDKEDIIQKLESWKAAIEVGSTDDDFFYNNPTEYLDKISLCYPVITSTLSSLGNIYALPESAFVKFKPFKLSICDEAGMVPIYCMPSILLRSKRAVVIGDQKQLGPIISIDKNRLLEFEKKNGITEDNLLYNPLVTSAFQRSSFANKSNVSDIGESIILDEHRRCLPEISDCFIDIGGYEGIINVTPPPPPKIEEQMNLLSSNAMNFINTSGESKGRRNVNYSEISEIKLLLETMRSVGVDLTKQVGIITPFQNQAVVLQFEFRELLQHSVSNKKIGTVHAFQGAEFDYIILSLVAYNDKFNINFLNQKPNLLNVAISRARFRLFTIGNMDFLLLKKGNLKKLVEHSKEYYN